jgi:uncharacterized protein (UPF0332 family)
VTTEILDKAQTALASAKLLLSAGDSDGATSRAYYAMFDAAKAALAWAGGSNDQPQHKTHSGLIAAFGLHLVKTGKLPAEFGRSLNRVQELRLTGDYLPVPVPIDKSEWAVQEAERFLEGVRRLLAQQPGQPSSG